VLKDRPTDFLVRESMLVDLADGGTGPQHYLILRKCGYTTMDAVRLVAQKVGLDPAEITFGGLKDEDGVTEQLLALPTGAVRIDDALAGWNLVDGADRWLRMLHYGYGEAPLRIGALEGNGFRIVVRNVDPATAQRLAERRKLTTLFLNYFDTQRFGVPHGPKRTHLAGRAILRGDWAVALREVAGLAAAESADAAGWTGPPGDFFAALDPRVTSFYLAAAGSHDWNGQLAALAATTDSYPVRLDGIDFRYPGSPGAAAAVLAAATDLPYDKYSFVAGAPARRQSTRAAVVQASVEIEAAGPDECTPGRSAVRLSFFLPSGSYATTMVRQLMGSFGEAVG
jgi:tRNA pseudouridine13 synthase